MDTLKIKAFLLIDKLGSFSKAAEAFSYTPSAFSHMADSLETELGVTLFRRTHKGVELTEEGQALKEACNALLEAERALLEEAAVLARGQAGNLRIGTYSSMALYLLPEILNGFKKEYPAVQTAILVDDKISTWLKENISDVVFLDRCPEGDVKWFPMMEDPYVVVVPEDMFPGREQVTVEELYDCVFIQTNDTKLKEYWDYNRFREIVQLNSVEDATAVSLVKGGIGVAVLPGLSMKEPPKGVRVLPLDPPRGRTLGFAVKSGKLSNATEWFVRYLQGRRIYE